jgi:DNA-directed RNA polymerase subunit RPC12/RpoP
MVDSAGYSGRDGVVRTRARSSSSVQSGGRSPSRTPPRKKQRSSEVPDVEKAQLIEELEKIQQAQAELQARQSDLLAKLKGEKPPKVPEHPPGVTQCQVCLKEFRTHRKLLKHVGTAHLGEQRHECSHCNRSFASVGYCRLHEKSCKGNKSPAREPRYICSDCGAEFINPWELAQHMKSHPRGGSWDCPYECGKSYKTEGSLRSHKSSCPRAPGFQKKECLFCNRQYSRQGDLNTHMKVDHGYSGGRGKPQKK